MIKMKLIIKNKEQNPLLMRMDIEADLEFEGATPSNNDVATEISAQLKTDLSLVVVKRIKTTFSEQKAQVEAVAYKTKEAKDKFEVMTKHLRKTAEEEAKKKAEAAEAKAEAKKAAAEAKAAEAEAKKEEAPVEEAKEEAPVKEEEPAKEAAS